MDLEDDPTAQSCRRLSATADRRACQGCWPDAYVGTNPPTYQWGFSPYGKFVSSLIAAQAANTPIEVVLDEADFNALGATGSDGFGANASIRRITVGTVIQKLTICWMAAPHQLKCAPYDDPGIPSSD